jgi:hypothetical protein
MWTIFSGILAGWIPDSNGQREVAEIYLKSGDVSFSFALDLTESFSSRPRLEIGELLCHDRLLIPGTSIRRSLPRYDSQWQKRKAPCVDSRILSSFRHEGEEGPAMQFCYPFLRFFHVLARAALHPLAANTG